MLCRLADAFNFFCFTKQLSADGNERNTRFYFTIHYNTDQESSKHSQNQIVCAMRAANIRLGEFLVIFRQTLFLIDLE